MRDIFLITNKEITWSGCKSAILGSFPEAKGNDKIALIGKSPKTVQIWFDGESKDDCAGFSKEMTDKIPFETKFITNIEFHTKKYVCDVLNALKPAFPTMYIIDDEDNVIGVDEYTNQM